MQACCWSRTMRGCPKRIRARSGKRSGKTTARATAPKYCGFTRKSNRHHEQTGTGGHPDQADFFLSQALGAALRHRPIPADVARGNARARLGFLRRHHRHRRRLHRPSEFRHGAGRKAAGSAGLSRRHHQPARLAFGRRLQAAGQAEPVLRRHRRQHGFDGQPLYRRQENPLHRRLHARCGAGQAPGPRGDRLLPALPRSLSRCAACDRQHRSQPAPHRALRLLVGHDAALDPARRQGRPAAVRQRRARAGGTRAPPGQGRERQGHPRPARQRRSWCRTAGDPRAGPKPIRPRSIRRARSMRARPYAYVLPIGAGNATPPAAAGEAGRGLPPRPRIRSVSTAAKSASQRVSRSAPVP